VVEIDGRAYFGPFAVIAELHPPLLTIGGYYEGFYADFFLQRVHPIAVDVETIVDIVRAGGARTVLDLACGAGRLTMPLARAGLDVVGVDLSQTLLDVLASDAERERPAGRVEIERADVLSLHLGRRFDVVLLTGWTAPTLLGDDPARLLGVVREHLAPGGAFIFDRFPDDDLTQTRDEFRGRWTTHGGARAFTLVGERQLTDPPRRVVNLYTEVLDDEGRTVARHMTSDTERNPPGREVLAAIERERFHVTEQREVHADGAVFSYVAVAEPGTTSS
jgi:SAM-dependent methyltransferase